jgi:hypothetical protein
LCPAGDSSLEFEPDPKYFLKLAANTVVTAPDYGVTFRTVTETNFADPNDREITVYAVNVNGQPLTYLVRKKARLVAGTIKTYEASFGEAQKFSKFTLSDENVLDIISVRDSNGFTWYEVDYLAQDLVFDARENSNPNNSADLSVPPTHVLKIVRAPRRFVTRYNDEWKLELNFGSGVVDEFDTTVNLDPSKIATSEYAQNLASTSLDPSDFLSSRSYGLAPSNCTMTVTYVVGGGVESNVPSNTLTKIDTVEISNDKSSLSAAEIALFNDVVASLAVNNPEPATGGKGSDSIEEIRQNALAFFNAQNRLVNIQDYTVRAYAMPAKFGAPSKVFVIQDSQINSILAANASSQPVDGTFVSDRSGQNVINMYVLGYDSNKKLATLNTDVKNNIKTYLDQYRILTDEIRILDGFVVNIGVDFKIIVFKNYNVNEVLARCIDALRKFFDIEKWQMNQPIIYADVFHELASIDGVQSVTSVKIFNRYAYRDGADYNDFLYDIDAATMNGVVYPSLDPCIFEVRYPENDIIGSATQ